MGKILIKNGRTWDCGGFDLTDKVGNHICNTQGWRCVLTVSDGQVVYRN